MPDVPRVFISATSRDLGSYRRAVSDVLVTLNALPVHQDHFPPDYRTVMEMLRARIASCDAVICLVGSVYGQEPLTRAADQPRRSYTQMEYEIAVELNKPVFGLSCRQRRIVSRAVSQPLSRRPAGPPPDQVRTCVMMRCGSRVTFCG